MNQNHRGFQKIIAVSLVLLLFAGILPCGMSLSVNAATGDLTLNEEQAVSVEALGFSTDQPERYTPSGQLVDRTQSPSVSIK